MSPGRLLFPLCAYLENEKQGKPLGGLNYLFVQYYLLAKHAANNIVSKTQTKRNRFILSGSVEFCAIFFVFSGM